MRPVKPEPISGEGSALFLELLLQNLESPRPDAVELGQIGCRHSCQGVEAGVPRADEGPGRRRTYPSRQIGVGSRAHGVILARGSGGTNLNDRPDQQPDRSSRRPDRRTAAVHPTAAASHGPIADMLQVRRPD
jgi:hypothetical protein